MYTLIIELFSLASITEVVLCTELLSILMLTIVQLGDEQYPCSTILWVSGGAGSDMWPKTYCWNGKKRYLPYFKSFNNTIIQTGRVLINSLVKQSHRQPTTMTYVNEGSVLVVGIVLIILSVAVVGARFYVRMQMKSGLGIDDWLCMTALVRL